MYMHVYMSIAFKCTMHIHVYILHQVTGGAGFVGSHLVDRLMADGHEVHVHVQYASKKSYHTVEINRRLDGTTVPK